MKILILSTGKIEEYDDSYAARLIEQGRAVLPPPDQAKPAARKPRKAAERAGNDADSFTSSLARNEAAGPEEKPDKE